ncbi:ribosomal-protein-alanine acetyltransferase [Beutenbergia cavernae DSM 12333]|uniref:Ribosomal-protein-alanine acetyltransferase n=1 Tax=Beutenbergia cavernae (strain ATCC BAA-8 / DSM 12333 / CCUG 43141 / JCM 11478 / NBRC 16432 / NCIMB 13614 / HKI 0122) TaxID=471853 RepID=C5BZY4_BEUC1|nr:ribosomal protein S18-alanine N-acetyltransferase [Beutenbergia cavernae]ACQ81314.1 ribosomal-protein-alanine acetyltransferase [Beutenbergia cavernae DSM 12333]
MTPPVRLRRLTARDLDRVVELEPVLFGAGAWSRATYDAELARPDRRYVAAVDDDDALVGWAGIAVAAQAEIMTVGVAPGHRRRGIGAALLAALLDAARRAGSREVYLEVRAHDAGAQRLYERAGFVPLGIRKGYYQPEGADAVVMRLSLAAPPGVVGAEMLRADAVGTIPEKEHP